MIALSDNLGLTSTVMDMVALFANLPVVILLGHVSQSCLTITRFNGKDMSEASATRQQ